MRRITGLFVQDRKEKTQAAGEIAMKIATLATRTTAVLTFSLVATHAFAQWPLPLPESDRAVLAADHEPADDRASRGELRPSRHRWGANGRACSSIQ